MCAMTVTDWPAATSVVAGSNVTFQPFGAVAAKVMPVIGAVPSFWATRERSVFEPAVAWVLRTPSGVVSLRL